MKIVGEHLAISFLQDILFSPVCFRLWLAVLLANPFRVPLCSTASYSEDQKAFRLRPTALYRAEAKMGTNLRNLIAALAHGDQIMCGLSATFEHPRLQNSG